MTKKHFIALADAIREHNRIERNAYNDEMAVVFAGSHLNAIADFCQSQNPRFNRERWLGYIKGENGKNGGKVSKWKASDITDAQARLVCHLSPDAPVTDTDRKVTAADFNGTNTPKS